MNIKRQICIHGHFYQPSRANPWLETIEIQQDAYPYHDWNERINAECYAANGSAHILDREKRIKKIFNNYSRMSFNFGPVLLSWIKANDNDTYNAIISADKSAQERFGGHGSAIAQIYNHVIMPLASKKDKYIQVCWAVRDFEGNFGRKPEGIWLSEAAVDYQTLEVLAEFGIKYTILSPNQASGIRSMSAGSSQGWTDVSKGDINTRFPYLCRLKNGASIAIFFYDNEISTKMSFGNLLEDGNTFVKFLQEAPPSPQAVKDFSFTELVCVASDGETFGHHHRFGDMALAYALETFENYYPQTLTVFGKYLEENPPSFEVEIKESSSWSCSHGVCRWMEHCGCAAGEGSGKDWNQKWRTPLREAIDNLAEISEHVYETEMPKYIKAGFKDIWEPLYNYIDVINNRSIPNINDFLQTYKENLFPDNTLKGKKNAKEQLNTDIKGCFMLKLLEMYRNSMLMQSSDAWFFDDISRIEAVQVLRHALRTMEIIREITQKDYEPDFLNILKDAKSNISSYGDGQEIYQKYAKPASCGFDKIIAYLAFEALFKENPEEIFTYWLAGLETEALKIDHGEIIAGKAEIFSILTLEKAHALFVAYNFKNKDILSPKSASAFVKIMHGGNLEALSCISVPLRQLAEQNYKDIDFKKTSLEKMLRFYFNDNVFVLMDFLNDRQVSLAEKALLEETESIKPVLFNLFSNYDKIIADLSERKLQNFFLDGIFPSIEEFLGEVLLYYKFKEKGMSRQNLEYIRSIIAKTSTIDFINRKSFDILATQKIDEIADLILMEPQNTEMLSMLADFINLIKTAGLEPNFWKTRNKCLQLRDMAKSNAGFFKNIKKDSWLAEFKSLLDILGIAYD